MQDRISIEDAQKDAEEQFHVFWEGARVETITVSGADVKKVFDDYFSGRPPFGTADKKAEFPDAFAADALVSWCAANRQKMIVVTGDGDWASLCEGHPQLVHKKQLSEVLADFPNPEISKAIRDAFMENNYDIEQFVNTSLTNSLVGTSYDGGTISEVAIKKTEVRDVYVIQVYGSAATVEVRCYFVYVLRVHYDPNGRTYRVRNEWKPIRKIPIKARAIAEFGLTFNPIRPSDYAVDTIDIRQLSRPYSGDW